MVNTSDLSIGKNKNMSKFVGLKYKEKKMSKVVELRYKQVQLIYSHLILLFKKYP